MLNNNRSLAILRPGLGSGVILEHSWELLHLRDELVVRLHIYHSEYDVDCQQVGRTMEALIGNGVVAS